MKRKKSIIAAIAIAIMCLMPLFSMAQILKLDGVATERQTGDGAGGWGPAPGIDPGTGAYAPLGSGLWVLAASAGLYLLVKSKKKRRTKTVMLAALALTLGTTQCHKPTETESVNENGNEPQERTIYISLTSRNAYNPKTDMNLYNGTITWNNGDKVYVVFDGKLLSETPLTVTSYPDNPQWGSINGEISFRAEIGTNPDFFFYYVGSGVTFTPTANATSLKFDIANQKKSGCDVGEYMIGRTGKIAMTVDGNKYVPQMPNSVIFKPITSVVWLNTSDFGTGDMQLVGANALNTMTIDLGTPNNLIGTHSANISFTSSESVAVSVMPATAANAAEREISPIVLVFNGNNKSGSLDMNFGIKPGIEYARIDGSLRSPLDIAGIEGALPGLFSVSATKQVYFSKGNLWYDKTPNSGQPYWGFEANQYDFRTYPGKGSCINGTYKTSEGTPTKTYGLFGWGNAPTNGDIKTSTGDESSYSWTEWGTKIDNEGTWCTLTNSEWVYLMENRTGPKIGNTKNCRCAQVIVNDVPGILVFPDQFTWPEVHVSTIPKIFNTCSALWDESNVVKYSSDDFSYLEDEGVVFLPANGYRSKTSVSDVGTFGTYWSSTYYDKDRAHGCDFGVNPKTNAPYFTPGEDHKRSKGYSVRLVAEKKN